LLLIRRLVSQPCDGLVKRDNSMYYLRMQLNSQVRSLANTNIVKGLSGIMSIPPSTTCVLMQDLPKEALEQVAAYFQTLSEPTRLSLLNLLRGGERNVGELAQLTGFTAANVSRHLAMLTSHGLVSRESRGTSVYYRIADESVYALCDLVCGNLARRFERAASDRAVFVNTAARGAAAREAVAAKRNRARAARPKDGDL
jgi:DNA-binding transcriptional ArsR family regulator